MPVFDCSAPELGTVIDAWRAFRLPLPRSSDFDADATEAVLGDIDDSTEAGIDDATEAVLGDATESDIDDATESDLGDSTEAGIDDATESDLGDATEAPDRLGHRPLRTVLSLIMFPPELDARAPVR